MNDECDDIELDDETQELKDFSEALVGADIEFAKDMFKSVGKPMYVRVMRVNGNNCIGTCDFNPNRVNVAVDDKGIITSVISIG
jgi:hypothetical protein